MKLTSRTKKRRTTVTVLAGLVGTLVLGQLVGSTTARAAAPTGVLINGEIERIFLDAPGDVYAGGQIVVGGQVVTIPRNLLLDLPANRISLQQLFGQAPAQCVAAAETGLAKADSCNESHTGGIATISANRTGAGNVIAGDVLIQKGVEIASGVVTYIDYAEGWFRLNGEPGRAITGVMVRLNDPTARHTVQTGVGCEDGAPNCSPDPRFTLDPDNYTNAFSTGYPLCIPSTRPRTFLDVLDFDNNAGTASVTAQAAADGTGDVLCPDTNRNGTSLLSDDSRRMAPIVLGDWVQAEGNFETVKGVHFLSSHTTTVSKALQTKNTPDQPDYMYLEEAEIDAPGFQNQRARALLIGFASTPVPDVLFWTIHRDPARNAVHEFPLATSRGCDLANGGCTGFGVGLFKIRYDSDFIQQPTSAKLSPCAQLRRDPRMGQGFCPDVPGDDEFAVLSPMPHELQGRTGKKLADTAGRLRTIDVSGHEATNGQYLFPLGMNLGGIALPEAAEFNINTLSLPISFEGIPWLMDRRLSPSGCLAGGCQGGAEPLDPFPVSGQDPRTQALNTIFPGGAVPTGSVTDPYFTATKLSSAANRILSFVDPSVDNFNGDSSLLAYPPKDPAAQGITPTPALGSPGPLVSGFAPTAGTPKTTVQIGGIGLDTATGVSFNGAPALFTVLNGGRIAAVVPPSAASGPISVQLANATTVTSADTFIVNGGGAASVVGLTPDHGPVGTTVTVTGSNMATATGVSFNGANATGFTVGAGGSSIIVNVPAGAKTGPVTIQGPAGNADAGTFTVDASLAPIVQAMAPDAGPPGTVVTLSGPGLGAVTEVRFGGVVATKLTVVDANSVKATVPTGAVSAPVTVVGPAGTTVSAGPFTIQPLPAPPFASAGVDQQVVQGSTVTLNASGTTGATTLAWTQTSGPAVGLSDPAASKPTFVFPSAFTTLTFQVLATNLGGSSISTVTISAIPDQLTVITAQYRTGTQQWTVNGTAAIKAGDNIVTVRSGSANGLVVGTAGVDPATGGWTLAVRGSSVAPIGQIVITSSRGGLLSTAVQTRP